MRRRARMRRAVRMRARAPSAIRPITIAEGPPPDFDDLVTAAACFQTRLLLEPTDARRRCLPLRRRVVSKTPPLLTWSFLTVSQREPCWRWMRSFPDSGALPQASSLVGVVRLVTKGNLKAVSDGLGRPSMK